MTGSRLPFAGRTDAAGFLIDPAHTGESEAHRRIAASWVSGARLFHYGGKLLMLLPATTSVRAERAPGLPVRTNGARLQVPDGGTLVEMAADNLSEVDLSAVVDLDDVRVDVLSAAPGIPATPTTIEEPPPRPSRPLRARAGVGAADTPMAKRAEQVARGLRAAPEPARTGALARMLGRPPVAPLIRRKHARYLSRLTTSFRDQNWDEALRGAIALGGLGGGAWTTRLPGRRRGPLTPGANPPGGSSTVPYGPTVHQHLHDLYTAAAGQLEQDGQHVLAAFVHADLLNNPTGAVDLLERHGMYVEAAEVAEARNLDPAMAVRLWWRAGERTRALQVASTRGAFAAAVTRLQKHDREAALQLRREWMLERRQAGDHLGAVTAAWPERQLRDDAVPDIAAGIALGGHAAGDALAHWLEHAPTPEAVNVARTILGDDPDLGAARDAFVSALADHVVDHPAYDRELASLALAALMRGRTRPPGRTFHDVKSRLQKRADPLLVADLPRLKPPLGLDTSIDIDATASGVVAIYDAVAVGHNSVLVALGELGAQLLTHDGRVRARWDIPTHRLVIADHGGRVLLIGDRAPRFLVHQLDLPNQRPVPLPALDVMPLESYDGTRPVLASGRGLEWVEPTEHSWRVSWRELTDPEQRIFHVARDPENLAALFADTTINAWHWKLPSLRLHQRGTFEREEMMVVLAHGEVGRLHQESGVAVLDWHATFGPRLTTSTLNPDGPCSLHTSGSAVAVAEHTDTGTRLAVHAESQNPELATVRLPPAATPIFRRWNRYITTGHTQGRLVVLDTACGQVTADILVRA